MHRIQTRGATLRGYTPLIYQYAKYQRRDYDLRLACQIAPPRQCRMRAATKLVIRTQRSYRSCMQLLPVCSVCVVQTALPEAAATRQNQQRNRHMPMPGTTGIAKTMQHTYALLGNNCLISTWSCTTCSIRTVMCPITWDAGAAQTAGDHGTVSYRLTINRDAMYLS